MFYFTINCCPFVTLRNLPKVMFSLHIIALLNFHAKENEQIFLE